MTTIACTTGRPNIKVKAAKKASKALSDDPWLVDSIDTIVKRYDYFKNVLNDINLTEPGGLNSFSKGYLGDRGMSIRNDTFIYKEWAPSAKEAFFIGDFSMK